MKIALVSFGHIDVVLPLFKKIREKDIFIDLFLCFALNRKAESILDFNDVNISTGLTPAIENKNLLNIGIRKYLGDISSVFFFIFFNLKLRSIQNILLSFSLSKKLKAYDVIHFNGTNGVLPILIFLLRNKKLIFTIHDLYSHSGEKTKRNFAERLNKFLIKSKHPIIIQNSPDYNHLIAKYPGLSHKLNLIPFGVTEVYREFTSNKYMMSSSDLLFFGRISPYKGIEYLISALEKLQLKGVNIKTIIAGQGNVYFDTEDFKKLNIKLINKYISNEELVHLIENTKIVICPYTDATQSGVVMTSFAFNKPVIAANVGEFSNVIINNKNGFLFPPRDVDSLKSKIEYLISAPELLDQMKNNIEKFNLKGKYSWENISNKTIQLYYDINSL